MRRRRPRTCTGDKPCESLQHGSGAVPLPHRATTYRRLAQLAKGRHAFGSAKARRSVAERPQGVYGRLRAFRPGEYVVLDTTALDLFAMEPVTLRWVPVELTVAMDLFTRCILGLRLTPVSTTSQDVANLLFQCIAPQHFPGELTGEDGTPLLVQAEQVWPFHEVPPNVLVGSEVPDGVSQQRVGGLPACLPEAIVVDHGRQYLSAHVLGVCARLGITVQPAIVHKPTDKPTVERFFWRLREGLLQHLPAYKGPDVYSRGKDVEGKAFFYLTELEQVIREWVGTVYHSSRHAGLCVPEVPGLDLSPTEMFEVGLAKTGGLLLPSRPELAFEFLDVAWRTVQHYGIEVHGRRYNGAALTGYRNVRTPHGGVHALRAALLDPDTDPDSVTNPDLTRALQHSTRTREGRTPDGSCCKPPPAGAGEVSPRTGNGATGQTSRRMSTRRCAGTTAYRISPAPSP